MEQVVSLLGLALIVLMVCGFIAMSEHLRFRPRQRATMRLVSIGLGLVGCITVAFRLIAGGL